MRASDPAVRRSAAPAWNTGWLVLICEWRRWRRLGMSRWAAFSILLTSLHRLH